MPPTVRHLPPVAEREMPPSPMYTLLAQSDMTEPEFQPLLAQLDLRNRPDLPTRAKRSHPYVRNMRSHSPAPASRKEFTPFDPKIISDPGSDNEHEIAVQVRLVSKPKDSGRLTLTELQSIMGWLDAPFHSIRARLAELVLKEKLPPLCLLEQPKERLENIKTSMLKEYPELKMFHEAWPFEVLLSRHLKNLCEKARKSAPEPATSTSRRQTREGQK
ncbi:hypothetical protein F5051DRAFT_431464 [Lentinula edodes]|nr:hypothetical protein F5051DRAFT_431464 [Lentinula edodes]